MPNIQLMKLYNTYLGPASDTLIDLGSPSFRWNNIYISGTNSSSIVSSSSTNAAVLTATSGHIAGLASTKMTVGYVILTSGIRASGVGAPTVVEGDIWNDRIQRVLSIYVNSAKQTLVGTVYTATTNRLIGNTTASTSLFSTSSVGTLMFPPDFMAPGKLLRIRGAGIYSAPVTPGSASIVLTLGGSTLASLATSSFLGNATSAGFAFESNILCQTSGTTGKFSTVGNVNYQGVLGLNSIRVFDDLDADGTATTLNSTTHLLLDLNFTWDTIDSGKTVNIVYSSVEVLN